MSSTPRFSCADSDPSPLGRPLTFPFSGRTAPNRFLKAAMSEHLASFSFADVQSRGIPSQALIKAYGHWGEGQIGLSLTGNLTIDPAHLEAAGNTAIPRNAPFSGERFERFRELASAAKAHGSLIVAQISHPGRQTSEELQPHPISASDVPVKKGTLGMSFGKPRAATEEDISAIIDGFAHAAEYLEKAGFDGIELHAAHGYLLSQFLSASTNLRTDKYGGDLKNRMRLILEVRDEIAKRVSKNFIVGIKINSVEFQENGFQPEEARVLCHGLEEHEFDFVELSGGTYENFPIAGAKRPSTLEREAFYLEWAKLIVPELSKTKSYVTGGLKTVEGMVKALDTCDGVGIGRALCQEPYLCAQILSRKVKSAILQKLDMQNFGLTTPIGGLHIKQIGEDLQPIDLSKEENVNKVLAALGAWLEKIKSDKDLCQYPAIEGYNVPISDKVL